MTVHLLSNFSDNGAVLFIATIIVHQPLGSRQSTVDLAELLIEKNRWAHTL